MTTYKEETSNEVDSREEGNKEDAKRWQNLKRKLYIIIPCKEQRQGKTVARHNGSYGRGK